MSLVIDGEAGTITVPSATLTSLVTLAVERVDGIRVRRGRRHVEVEIADGRAQVTLELAARYGEILPELARQVQEQVTDALTTMCGVVVETVDVEVEEIE
jgi:uncharacterized alkaline shock family protein YloU